MELYRRISRRSSAERTVGQSNAGDEFAVVDRVDDVAVQPYTSGTTGQPRVDSHLHGTFHCTQVAGERMRQDGGGAVINLASIAGQNGSPYMSHYGAAKADIIDLTSTLAYEWADDDVRVNCIAPGFVATPGVESQMGVSADNIDRREVNRRIGITEGIAAIAQFLASPAASYVVGETITARGVPPILETPDV